MLTTLETRRIKADQTEVFEIMHHFEDLDISIIRNEVVVKEANITTEHCLINILKTFWFS